MRSRAFVVDAMVLALALAALDHFSRTSGSLVQRQRKPMEISALDSGLSLNPFGGAMSKKLTLICWLPYRRG